MSQNRRCRSIDLPKILLRERKRTKLGEGGRLPFPHQRTVAPYRSPPSPPPRVTRVAPPSLLPLRVCPARLDCARLHSVRLGFIRPSVPHAPNPPHGAAAQRTRGARSNVPPHSNVPPIPAVTTHAAAHVSARADHAPPARVRWSRNRLVCKQVLGSFQGDLANAGCPVSVGAVTVNSTAHRESYLPKRGVVVLWSIDLFMGWLYGIPGLCKSLL